MIRRLTALAALFLLPYLSGCCCYQGCGYRLFNRPYMFGNGCGGCGNNCGASYGSSNGGCASCYGGAPAAGPGYAPPVMVPSAAGPAIQPIPQLSQVPPSTTMPTRALR